MLRTCNICKSSLDITLFAKSRNAPSGYGYRCRACHNASMKKHYAANASRCRALGLPVTNKAKVPCEQCGAPCGVQYKRCAKCANKTRPKGKANRKWAGGYYSKYGIDADRYIEMWQEQNGLCAVCEKPENGIHPLTKRKRPLSVDHNHESGLVRGLLCHRCNIHLGAFEDDADLLEKAAAYLRRFATNGEQGAAMRLEA